MFAIGVLCNVNEASFRLVAGYELLFHDNAIHVLCCYQSLLLTYFPYIKCDSKLVDIHTQHSSLYLYRSIN